MSLQHNFSAGKLWVRVNIASTRTTHLNTSGAHVRWPHSQRRAGSCVQPHHKHQSGMWQRAEDSDLVSKLPTSPASPATEAWMEQRPPTSKDPKHPLPKSWQQVLVPRSRPDRRFGGVRGSSIRSGNVLADHHYIHNCVFMSVYTHVLRSSPLYLKWQDYRWAFIFFLNIVHIFRKENSVARGVQWVAMCNPTTRCHKILLYGP